MEEVKEKIAEKKKRNTVSKFFNAKGDRDTVAAWKADLTRVLLVFNVRLAGSTPPSLTTFFRLSWRLTPM